MSEFTFIKVGTSTGVQLQEYQGSINLQAGYEQKDGKIGLKWVRGKHYDKDQKKEVEDSKDTPLKIYLGNKEMARDVLKALYWQIDQLLKEKPKEQPKTFPEEDVPF